MREKTRRQAYASDLTDNQWEEIEPLYTGMRTYKWSKRELTNGVLYLVDSGYKWRQLPHDFPPHTTVSNFYYAAIKNGLCEKLLPALVRNTREQTCHTSEPSYAIIDSQSVKTVGPSKERGIDGRKKRKVGNGTLL